MNDFWENQSLKQTVLLILSLTFPMIKIFSKRKVRMKWRIQDLLFTDDRTYSSFIEIGAG